MADKRIRELQTDSALPLNWRLPFDYIGLVAAEYRTLQQVVDVINENLELPLSYTGSTNPDDALGTNGSTYYKYVAGSVFGIWFKSAGSWTPFLEINIGSAIQVSGTSDASGEYDASGDGIGEFPNVTIYDVNELMSPAQYDNANKKIIGLNPSEAFTAKFS